MGGELLRAILYVTKTLPDVEISISDESRARGVAIEMFRRHQAGKEGFGLKVVISRSEIEDLRFADMAVGRAIFDMARRAEGLIAQENRE